MAGDEGSMTAFRRHTGKSFRGRRNRSQNGLNIRGERLEERTLLAGDYSLASLMPLASQFKPFQNPVKANDVNVDGKTSLLDVLAIARDIRQNGARELNVGGGLAPLAGAEGEGAAPTEFVDVNGDNIVNMQDILAVARTLRGAEGQVDQIRVTIGFTDLADNPITEVPLGQQFKVNVYVEDLRDIATEPNNGVRSAYPDITYDSGIVSITTAPIPAAGYMEDTTEAEVPGANDYLSTPGTILNNGGTVTNAAPYNTTGQESGGDGPVLLTTNIFTATSALPTTATFTPGPSSSANFDFQLFVVTPFAPTPIEDVVFVANSIDLVLSGVAAVDDTETFDEDEPFAPVPVFVLTNDLVAPPGTNPGTLVIDSVGATGTATGGATAQGGTVFVHSSHVDYTPAPDFFGTDTFFYLVRDTVSGITDIAEVTVTVTPVNDPPNAVDDALGVPTGDADNPIDVLGNDWSGNIGDPYETQVLDPLTITEINALPLVVGVPFVLPSGAEVTYDGTTLFYNPKTLAVGDIDTFDYTIEDTEGLTSSATVDVTVGLNAVDDDRTVQQDSINNSLDVLTNDSGSGLTIIIPDGVAIDTPSGNGSIYSNGTTLFYTPDPGFFGTDTFTYTIEDGDGNTDVATVTVTVNGTPDAVDDPDVVDDPGFTVVQNGSNVSLDVLANDSDPDGDPLVITVPGAGPVATPHGSITSDGSFVYYTPDPDYVGLDTFTYTISDGNGGTDTATVTVRVIAPPSSLTGFVYADVNNNGIMESYEQRLGGVTVTLTGTTVFGDAVSTVAVTDGTGAYSFINLEPGSYLITETDPLLMVDGIDSIAAGGGVGAHGTVFVGNDVFSVNITSQVDATGFNFGERGLEAPYIPLRNFFASNPLNSLTVAMDLSAGAIAGDTDNLWFSFRGDWSPHLHAHVDLAPDLSSVTLVLTDDVGDEVFTTFSPITNNNFHRLGQVGDHIVIRFDGLPTTYDLLPGAGPEGEGEDVDDFFANGGL